MGTTALIEQQGESIRLRIGELVRKSLGFEYPVDSAHSISNEQHRQLHDAKLDWNIKELEQFLVEHPGERYIPSESSPLNALLAHQSTARVISDLRVSLDQTQTEWTQTREMISQDKEMLKELQLIEAGLNKEIAREKKADVRNILQDFVVREEQLQSSVNLLLKSLISFIDDYLPPYLASEAAGYKPGTIHTNVPKACRDEYREMKELLEKLMNGTVDGDPWVQLENDSASSRFLVRAGVAVYNPGNATILRMTGFADKF